MITVTLFDADTLALSGGYAEKDAIKRMGDWHGAAATWNKAQKVWLVPLRFAALVRRLPCEEAPEAAAAMDEAIRAAHRFNAAGFRSMAHVSPLIREYCAERGIE